MKEENKYIVIPSLSVSPNKIAFYSQVYRSNQLHSSWNNNEKNFVNKKEKTSNTIVSKRTLSNFHELEISPKAKKRIKEKVTWLYHLAKKKVVQFSSGKVIYNHKMSFITLTMPAKQKHTSKEIIQKPLHNFITEMNRRFGMENYVWRLEWQKNGNAHFHIATDTAVDYFKIRSIWNRSIQLLGYIDDYSENFRNLSLAEYNKKVNPDNKTPFDVIKQRYSYGTASRWRNPNTVSVNSAVSGKEIAFYISKYITKQSSEPISDIVVEREGNECNFRLWYCSRSLSKLNNISMPIDSITNELHTILCEIKPRFMNMSQYAEVWYYSIVEQSKELQKVIDYFLRQYAEKRGYKPFEKIKRKLADNLQIT